MAQSKITFIVNGNTYRFAPNDLAAMEKVTADDRRDLLLLLENLKSTSNHVESAPLKSAAVAAAKPAMAANQKVKPAIDPDILMAQLIKEERKNIGSSPTKKTFYKFIVGFTCLVIILILLF